MILWTLAETADTLGTGALAVGGGVSLVALATLVWRIWIHPLRESLRETRVEAREERQALEARVRALELAAAANGVIGQGLRDDVAALTVAVRELPDAIGARVARAVRAHEDRCRGYQGAASARLDREDNA